MANETRHDGSAGSPSNSPDSEQLARQQAVRQIERRRRYWTTTITWFIVLIVVAVIWAMSEYNNAGGWPTKGFSQSSGNPHAWNYWIVYPFFTWMLGAAIGGWNVYGRRPISESEIKQEMERQRR